MKKESWWEIFLMNVYKGAYNAKSKIKKVVETKKRECELKND